MYVIKLHANKNEATVNVADGNGVSVSFTSVSLAMREPCEVATLKEHVDPWHSCPHGTLAKEEDRAGSNSGSHGSALERQGLHGIVEMPLVAMSRVSNSMAAAAPVCRNRP